MKNLGIALAAAAKKGNSLEKLSLDGRFDVPHLRMFTEGMITYPRLSVDVRLDRGLGMTVSELIGDEK